MPDSSQLIDRLRFGGREPGRDEIAFLCNVYAELAVCTRKGLGVRGWFV